MTTVWRGHLFHLTGAPTLADAASSLIEHTDGMVVVSDAGQISAAGAWNQSSVPEGAAVHDHRGQCILPGFVDTHAHYPQVNALHTWGGGSLLRWLDHCIFPAEAELADPSIARMAAKDVIDAMLACGTTTALIYGSQFSAAQDALFDELHAQGMRAVVGRTAMVNGPKDLTAPIDETLRLCREEIDRWHPRAEALDDALVHVALVPRFALSFDGETLGAIGELWADVRDRGVRFTTHLSENPEEVEAVRRAFGVSHYLDAYDACGLLGPRSVLAHAVHCDDHEIARLAETDSAVSHCPTSQLFLGNGTMPIAKMMAAGIRLGLGTDVAAGDTFSLPEVANAAYKVHVGASARQALHPAELLHLATIGGAGLLGLSHRTGNLDPGKDADLVIIDPERHPPLAGRLSGLAAGSPVDRLFALLMGMGRETIVRTLVRGRVVWQRRDR
ncbi:MAG: guanine deaminase [Planctomycetota bacterium]|nr:guanine deaminase [Planctomycetota bacterium]